MIRTKDSILNDYKNNVKAQQDQIDSLKSKLNKISFSRLGMFVAEIIIVALLINIGFSWALIALMIIPVIAFLALIKKQISVQQELTYAGQLLWVYQNEVNHLTSNINGYNNGESYSNEYHPYASDLDIYGQGTLFSYINRCNTSKGLNILADNLGRPNEKEVILQRQEAISELTQHIDQTYHFRAGLQSHKPGQLQAIQEKLEHQLPEQLKFVQKKGLQLYVKIIPFIAFGLLILGAIFGGLVWKVFGLVAIVNIALIFFNLKDINLVYYGFTKSSDLLSSISGTIKWTEDVAWKSTYIRTFFESNNDQNLHASPVSKQIKQLSSIIQSFDARLNLLVGFFLNLFFLWDLKCSIDLNNWYSKSSANLSGGLDRISQFEELISFATLAYNQPNWNFPAIAEDFNLKGIELGHPLIHESERIVNDFNLESYPTVDIVTGSNMAGKSTFLRTVGINMVLAFAGAPVCAKEMSVSIFKVLSYMRIKDSLNDHTSTFKAELNRLKMILDSISISANSFVLIDEMLRGTNSRDKYLGSKVFIEKLITQNTPALFATHDLQLSEMETDHGYKVRNYHFDIQIADDEMEFDYKLKHGPCKTFNAALLLKQIGLTLS
ncbi:DNA mismatch repair protein MutS [Pedobacter ginsengisoli]|uniref:DNA mismatch repair protein MutS n=1 Tax=Pedobacter ginsengisoli TaxID=363852 RepID=A0A2D1UB63_9SPHI|nr:DNA mismatch repair protein MutS [Pedobacter ginsengisoli]ATP58856.1 DNA mismatch repair protein MutS [Pedobacter ginsengisoli]